MYAEVAVDTHHDPTKKLFTYQVPSGLPANPGDLVEAPFGKREIAGFVYRLSQKSPSIKTKPLSRIKKRKLLTPQQIELAYWMEGYYHASPLDCLKCQIPGKGRKETKGTEKEIDTLLLVPYASQISLRALKLSSLARKKTLVGSRSAVFTNLPNLKRIIVEEPENWAYKEERSPYYHTKEVAQKRAETEGLDLEFSSLIPRAEDFPSQEKDVPKTIGEEIEIANLKKEREAGNFSPLSLQAGKIMTKGRRALAFINSRQLEDELRSAAKARGLDSNHLEIAGPEIFASVGRSFEAGVIVDADTLLNLPDFRAHEKLLTAVVKIARIVKGPLVIQTANPHYPLFREITSGRLEDFYKRELEERKRYQYPPFGVLAKICLTGKNKDKISKEAEELSKKTRKKAKTLKDVRVSPPYPPYTKKRGRAQLNIAIIAQRRKDLDKVLNSIPSAWKIVVDPESLL
jgi:primosomal protein N'